MSYPGGPHNLTGELREIRRDLGPTDLVPASRQTYDLLGMVDESIRRQSAGVSNDPRFMTYRVPVLPERKCFESSPGSLGKEMWYRLRLEGVFVWNDGHMEGRDADTHVLPGGRGFLGRVSRCREFGARRS